MTAPATAPPTAHSADSIRLRDIATDAWTEHLLPALRRHMPEIIDEVVVTITSSVAYGTADEHSDLDVFVIFRRERDYARYADQLQKLIERLDLDAVYGAVCDKGVRFELESLQRSDLSGLFYHPERARTWHRQTEWLLFWFLQSIPIHDPGGIHARLSRRAGHWPPPVLAARRESAQTKIVSWARTSRRQLAATGAGYVAVRAAGRAATAGLDLAYLTAGRFGPHPKWRHPHARRLLADHPAALDVLHAVERLGQVLIDLPDNPSTLSEALDAYEAALVSEVPLSDWRAGALAGGALPFADRDGIVWVARDRSPATSFFAAARGAAAAGEVVYLADELGSDLLEQPGYSYDHALRIAPELRWLAEHAAGGNLTVPSPILNEGPSIRLRRWLYFNFVIWRKLRVVAKSHRRRQPFTCRWYQLQVIDHLIEARANLADTQPPPLHRHTASSLAFLDRRWTELLAAGALPARLRDVDGFLSWGWEEYADIQRQLLARRLLPQAAASDPLSTQWDVQYWKYENLFI